MSARDQDTLEEMLNQAKASKLTVKLETANYEPDWHCFAYDGCDRAAHAQHISPREATKLALDELDQSE